MMSKYRTGTALLSLSHDGKILAIKYDQGLQKGNLPQGFTQHISVPGDELAIILIGKYAVYPDLPVAVGYEEAEFEITFKDVQPN